MPPKRAPEETTMPQRRDGATAVVTAIGITIISFAATGVLGWSFRTSVGGFESKLEDHEKRLRAVESGDQFKAMQMVLTDMRERLVRIETQLAADPRRR